MHADLESSLLEVADQITVEAIALGHEVEGGAEAETLLQPGHLRHISLAVGGLDVVGKNESARAAVGPEMEKRRVCCAPIAQQVAHSLPEKARVAVLPGPAELEVGPLQGPPVCPPQAFDEPAREGGLDTVIEPAGAAPTPMAPPAPGPSPRHLP